MNVISRGIFYSNLATILSLFYLDSLGKGNSMKRKKILQDTLKNFRYKNKKDAYSELERMAANIDPEFFERWKTLGEKHLIKPQLNIIVEGEENLLQKENEVIAFVSSHRSLYDIALLGIILHNKVKLPIYTAGSNLAKGPIKYGLKKMGAALLDREKLKKGDLFEIRLALDYLEALNIAGENTVNFAEATRSRSTAFDKIHGLFLKPPLEAQKERKELIYKMIFLTESYDRIPEDTELIKNKKVSGEKKPFSRIISDILFFPNWVGRDFGNVYATISKPIYLNGIRNVRELGSIAEKELKKNYKITDFMLMAYSFSENSDIKDASKNYAETAHMLREGGFNVNPTCSERFFHLLNHPFTKRMEKNSELLKYYADFIYQIKN